MTEEPEQRQSFGDSENTGNGEETQLFIYSAGCIKKLNGQHMAPGLYFAHASFSL